MKSLLLSLCLVAALAGCATATVGAEFQSGNLSKLQPGTTTLQQATELLGTAPQKSSIEAGEQVYQWLFVRSHANTFVSSTQTSVQSAVLVFDANGKLRGIRRLQGISLPSEDAQRLLVK
jgi:hypothetical protein